MTEPLMALPAARVRPASNWSAIWVLPIIALLIGSWLGWKAYSEQGVMINIQFVSGDGIVPGKTELIYKGIALGKVATLDLNKDKTSVVAHIEVSREASDYLRNETTFWLVQPRVSLAGVTGLETLVSGNYITMEPGDGKKRTHFQALSEPPPISDNLPGLHIQLNSRKLESLSEGSPVYYRQIQVGQVNSYKLADDQQSVLIKLHIRPEFEHLVNASTRFWNVSGVNIAANLSGVKINVESLASVLAGGVAFDTVESGETQADNAAKAVYPLYENYEEAQVGILIHVALPDFSGLEPGITPVRWRGRQLGLVKNGKVDPDLRYAIAEISMDPRTAPYLTEGAQFWMVKPSISLAGIKGLDALTKGNYIELKPGKRGAPPVRSFEALLIAPAPDFSVPGLHLKLTADKVGSISIGAPVLYRQLKVGSVADINLAANQQQMQISLLIEPQYAALVNRSTQFWNASGISVSGGLAGLQIKSDSLQSLIEGGIAFDTPDQQSKRVGNGYGFSLFADEASATEKGSLIELEVASGEGLHSGTSLRFKGLEVGKVQSVALNSQRTGVLLKVRVFDAADLITRQGSQFWVVRPELGILRSANLDTLVSGPYLQVLPAANTAPSVSRFTALSSAPDVQEHLNGLQLVLTTSQRHSLKPGIPVTYRGMVVGQISYLTLSKQAEQVLVHILIEPRYATLVHSGSQFWNTSGINVGYSLLKGVKVRTESIESIVEGGIAFATPDDASQGAAALQGQRFALNDESKAEWLKWQPRFNLGK